MSSCEDAVEGLNWDALLDCQPLPLSVILLLFVTAGWTFFYGVTFVRGVKHSCSSTKDVVVAKKMQQLQMWFYSFFYTMVYLTSVFATISLFKSGYTASGGFLAASVLLSQSLSSTIDVVGSTSKKQGINDIDMSVTLQQLLTMYLPKAVWKTSGHKEYDQEEDSSARPQKLVSAVCCLDAVDNHITPQVYDVKDVATMQGAFLGFPALCIYLLTFLRSNDNNKDFEFNVLMQVAVAFAFLSTLLPPILGDWETFARDMKLGNGKTVAYTGLSLAKRSLELTGRMGMYMFLIDFSKFAGFGMMGIEVFLMYATYLEQKDVSVAGRTGTTGHYVLSSVLSFLYGFYRRLSVDKEFTTQGNMMSATIELIRYVVKAVATVAGYFWILGLNVDITEESGLQAKEVLFYAGLAANVILVPVLIVEFVAVKRSQLDRKEMSKLVKYWKTWAPCRKLCDCSTKTHINRDQNMGGATHSGTPMTFL